MYLVFQQSRVLTNSTQCPFNGEMHNLKQSGLLVTGRASAASYLKGLPSLHVCAEYGPGEFTPVDEEAVPDYLASVDLDDDDDVNEDPHPTTSELGSLPPGTTAGDAEQVAPAPQQAAAASSRDQARATEQQAAADMSSMLQQDVGQFDEAQAARVSPDSMLPVSSPEGTAPVPDQDGSRQQLGEDVQHQTQHSIGQQSSGVPPQVDQEAAKPKKRAGRPKKKDDDSTPKKKPGRRKKADKKADTAQKGFF